MNSLSYIPVLFLPRWWVAAYRAVSSSISYYRRVIVSGANSRFQVCVLQQVCEWEHDSMNGWCSIAETTMVHCWHKMAAAIIFQSTLAASETLICSIHYSNRFSGGESGGGYYYDSVHTTQRCVCKYHNTILIQWTGTTSTFVTDKLMHWNNELL